MAAPIATGSWAWVAGDGGALIGAHVSAIDGGNATLVATNSKQFSVPVANVRPMSQECMCGVPDLRRLPEPEQSPFGWAHNLWVQHSRGESDVTLSDKASLAVGPSAIDAAENPKPLADASPLRALATGGATSSIVFCGPGAVASFNQTLHALEHAGKLTPTAVAKAKSAIAILHVVAGVGDSLSAMSMNILDADHFSVTCSPEIRTVLDDKSTPNFNVFYDVPALVSPAELQQLDIGNMASFPAMKGRKVQGTSDPARVARFTKAMADLGLAGLTPQLSRMVAALLHFSKLLFNTHSETGMVERVRDSAGLAFTSKLLSLTVGIEDAMFSPMIEAGFVTLESATEHREEACQHLYRCIINWIVAYINQMCAVGEDGAVVAPASGTPLQLSLVQRPHEQDLVLDLYHDRAKVIDGTINTTFLSKLKPADPHMGAALRPPAQGVVLSAPLHFVFALALPPAGPLDVLQLYPNLRAIHSPDVRLDIDSMLADATQRMSLRLSGAVATHRPAVSATASLPLPSLSAASAPATPSAADTAAAAAAQQAKADEEEASAHAARHGSSHHLPGEITSSGVASQAMQGLSTSNPNLLGQQRYMPGEVGGLGASASVDTKEDDHSTYEDAEDAEDAEERERQAKLVEYLERSEQQRLQSVAQRLTQQINKNEQILSRIQVFPNDLQQLLAVSPHYIHQLVCDASPVFLPSGIVRPSPPPAPPAVSLPQMPPNQVIRTALSQQLTITERHVIINYVLRNQLRDPQSIDQGYVTCCQLSGMFPDAWKWMAALSCAVTPTPNVQMAVVAHWMNVGGPRNHLESVLANWQLRTSPRRFGLAFVEVSSIWSETPLRLIFHWADNVTISVECHPSQQVSSLVQTLLAWRQVPAPTTEYTVAFKGLGIDVRTSPHDLFFDLLCLYQQLYETGTVAIHVERLFVNPAAPSLQADRALCHLQLAGKFPDLTNPDDAIQRAQETGAWAMRFPAVLPEATPRETTSPPVAHWLVLTRTALIIERVHRFGSECAHSCRWDDCVVFNVTPTSAVLLIDDKRIPVECPGQAFADFLNGWLAAVRSPLGVMLQDFASREGTRVGKGSLVQVQEERAPWVLVTARTGPFANVPVWIPRTHVEYLVEGTRAPGIAENKLPLRILVAMRQLEMPGVELGAVLADMLNKGSGVPIAAPGGTWGPTFAFQTIQRGGNGSPQTQSPQTASPVPGGTMATPPRQLQGTISGGQFSGAPGGTVKRKAPGPPPGSYGTVSGGHPGYTAGGGGTVSGMPPSQYGTVSGGAPAYPTASVQQGSPGASYSTSTVMSVVGDLRPYGNNSNDPFAKPGGGDGSGEKGKQQQPAARLVPTIEVPPLNSVHVGDNSIEQYASQYYETKSGSIFGKKKGAFDQKMLTYSDTPLKKPLTRSAYAEVRDTKTALETSTWIMTYMGDFKAKGTTQLEAAKFVIENALSSSALVDETYCQIVKQITQHPRPEGALLGFRLMSMCAAFLAPSDDLFSSMCRFMQQQLRGTTDPALVALVNFVYSNMYKTIKVGCRNLGPSREELEALHANALIKFRVELPDRTARTYLIDSFTVGSDILNKLEERYQVGDFAHDFGLVIDGGPRTGSGVLPLVPVLETDRLADILSLAEHLGKANAGGEDGDDSDGEGEGKKAAATGSGGTATPAPARDPPRVVYMHKYWSSAGAGSSRQLRTSDEDQGKGSTSKLKQLGNSSTGPDAHLPPLIVAGLPLLYSAPLLEWTFHHLAGAFIRGDLISALELKPNAQSELVYLMALLGVALSPDDLLEVVPPVLLAPGRESGVIVRAKIENQLHDWKDAQTVRQLTAAKNASAHAQGLGGAKWGSTGNMLNDGPGGAGTSSASLPMGATGRRASAKASAVSAAAVPAISLPELAKREFIDRTRATFQYFGAFPFHVRAAADARFADGGLLFVNEHGVMILDEKSRKLVMSVDYDELVETECQQDEFTIRTQNMLQKRIIRFQTLQGFMLLDVIGHYKAAYVTAKAKQQQSAAAAGTTMGVAKSPSNPQLSQMQQGQPPQHQQQQYGGHGYQQQQQQGQMPYGQQYPQQPPQQQYQQGPPPKLHSASMISGSMPNLAAMDPYNSVRGYGSGPGH
ncbi:hypothetical protein H9P43_001529 [Blastocladiella emersonii ATCC 22665]|nr:hypothetical protein H9P43_001529 [Blastocladiella emersonii ATCC 22665]